MATHKYVDKICIGIAALTLLLACVCWWMPKTGTVPVMAAAGYESRLFDVAKVHTIDIKMGDWDAFLAACEDEEYRACSVAIDGEEYFDVGIRAKGNTSLRSVAAYGNGRYSFKIEFDCYESGRSYHGLDKISLNNIIQDNTYMKDYLVYRLMGDFGVDAPLCSYAYITVNGEDWGLYLAVEGVEESFLARNYGSGYGELYKPDSMDMGGGRGQGEQFDMEKLQGLFGTEMPGGIEGINAPVRPEEENGTGENVLALPPRGEGLWKSNGENPFDGEDRPWDREDGGPAFREGEKKPPVQPGKGGMPMGSDDVRLVYTDDAYDSYQNIFGNAKTDITNADKDRLIASLKKLGEREDLEEILDVEEVLRYFVVHNFVCNFDSYTGAMIHNYYLYEKEGRLSMIPWDYNLAFGGFGQGAGDATAMVNFPIDTPVSGGAVEERPMLSWIFAKEEYTEQYHAYFAEFLQKYFASGVLEEELKSVKEMIAPYVEKDPTRFCTYEAFETGTDTLKEFCLLRAQSIEGQLAGSVWATAEGQKKDSAALVDASHISLSAMGNMDNMMRDGERPQNGP